jgi:hypothetical protein
VNVANVMTCALVAAAAATSVTLAGVASARLAARRSTPRDVGGPYRSPRPASLGRTIRPGERLVAVGSALVACAAGPALVIALLALKWEGIGVTLFPALLVVGARLYASFVTFSRGDLGPARTIAHASLLLDVPLLVFSIVHVRLDDGAAHEAISLAIVAGAFALADGLQAMLVLTVPHATPRATRD